MVKVNIKFPAREIGAIVEKKALEKKEDKTDQVKLEMTKMINSLYDKANGGVIPVVSGRFRDSFFVDPIDTKNKLGVIFGFDPKVAPHVDFVLAGTVFMEGRDIVEMTKVEFDFPNNIINIINSD